jgi:uncharacterized RDD family membrane protein YckC
MPGGAICSARRRLAAYLLDGVVISLTFVVGWYAWCLVRYRGVRGPGKHLLGMAVVDRRTGAKPTLRRGLLRGAAKWLLLAQVAVPILLVLDYLDRAARSLEVVPDRYLSATSAALAVALQVALLLVTTCWLLWDPQRRQLWDRLAGTIVVRDRAPTSAPPPRDQPEPASG